MNLKIKYPILVKLLRPFGKSQQKTCISIISALLEEGYARRCTARCEKLSL